MLAGWLRAIRLGEYLFSVREVLYFLATLWLFQVHFPVHLPCYDLPPLGLASFLVKVEVSLGRVTGGVYAFQDQF